MNQVSTVGLDLAKYIFQLHGADSAGAVVFRKKLRRGQLLAFLATLPPCTVAMEACGSAHYWGREIAKLGHTVKLIAPAYVKPFVKRQKNDMADAEAICEAAQRPTMRFVALKSANQQAAAVVFRTRDLLVRQRTQAINALRGHLTEFGVIAAKGPVHTSKLIAALEDPASDLPQAARAILAVLVEELRSLDERVAVLDREIARHAKENCGRASADDHPGHRGCDGRGSHGAGPTGRHVPARPRFCRLARVDPGSALERGQGAARQDIQDGRALAATLADHRRQRGGPLGRAQGRSGWLVAGAHARPQAADAGAGGAGQQDGPDRLGAAGQGWGVSSSGCGGVGAVTTARLSRRGRVRGEGWRTVKRPDQENQLCDKRFKRVGLNWT